MIASARVSFGVMFLAPAKCQGGDLNRCSKLHRCSITLSAVASNVDVTVRPAAIEIRQLAAITKALNPLWISPGRMEPGGLIGAPGRLASLLSLPGLG
jgi:hypothetical protein